MMDSLLALLRGAAPVLATAVAGPLGGAAVQAIAQKFGVESTVAAVATAIAGDPQAAQKLAELEFQYAKLEADDRASARSMQTAALGQTDWFAKNFVNLLALVIVVGSGTLLFISKDQDVRMAAVSFVTFILGFYYGTSQSSQRKTELMAKQ
jgi:1,4-dihydroxy-2-naphthoate octaprenyltransferase